MSKFKKIFAVLMTAVMLICAFSISAGAESIYNNAKTIASGKKYSAQIKLTGKPVDYKITTKDSGTLKLDLNVQISNFGVYVYDANGNKITRKSNKITSGKILSEMNTVCYFGSNGKFSGTLSYNVNKGTYYIRIERMGIASTTGNGKITLKATFPSKASSSVSGISVPMKVGGSLQLSAVTSGSSSKATWTSSNKSVATVSSTGKVTAKKKGSTTITVKVGSSKASVVITVS